MQMQKGLSPKILEQYRAYNLVEYKNSFFGIPVSLVLSNLNNGVELVNPQIIRTEKQDDLYQLIDEKSSYVKRIRFDITDNCNLRCVMCCTYDGISKGQMRFFSFDNSKRTSHGKF